MKNHTLSGIRTTDPSIEAAADPTFGPLVTGIDK
jgi:hypothetical protein